MDNKIRVLLVDDNTIFASTLKEMFAPDKRLDYLGHASCRTSGIEMSCQMNPDIVLMDLNLSGTALDGIETAKEIRIKTGIRILLLTAYEKKDIILDASKRAFASGYIFKSHFKTLADIIYETATSNTPAKEFIRELILQVLTPAERAIFDGLIEGDEYRYSHAEPSTIEKQKTSIYKKLRLKNKHELQKVFVNW